MSVCHGHGCNVELPPKNSGNPRKWCSERCRKSKYSLPCPDCGKPLSGSDGRGPHAPTRCVPCAAIASGSQRRVWTPETVVAAMHEWAAEHDGIYPTVWQWSPAHARSLGLSPHPDYVNHSDRWPCLDTVKRAFGGSGGWRRAVITAGFTPRERGTNLTQMGRAA